ncbi:hypothetical protein DB30_06739 [Enhygromyxa salina]|uniref:Uncharacterized protein n=1 Tax=Enhygromyxa salina TaxID=215803 RepID=A0A0C2D2Z3_9BACT|nr:hypothetical protein [Enhygromyxa salina]KIG14512.1 hypothetical protein DB30_06739 [Enhygromyxa salina]
MSEARDNVDEWAAAGLSLQRGVAPGAELLTRVRPWLEATLELFALLPPLGIVADLGRLLARDPFDIAASVALADPELRAALDAYEEHVLGRLSADYRLEHARDALLRLELGVRPTAIAVFVDQILGRIRQAQRPGELELDSPGPTAIRRVLHRHGVELLELGAAALDDPQFAPLRRELGQVYAGLAKGARQCGALIGDVELYTLENHEALHSPSLRLAMAQIADAAQAIERSLPVRVRRSDASRGRTPTKVEDESAYPIGGYASIATVGGIESLVSSELIYMNPADERAAGHVDLFDVRWAAGELLKYTRDESVHTRERRTICFALAPELDDARLKDADVPFQRIVVAFGAVIAGVRKLCAWLDEAELDLRIVTIGVPSRTGGAAAQPLRPELELARLILREFIESGVVTLLEVDDPDAARAHASEAAVVGGSDLVWLLGAPFVPSEPTKPSAPSGAGKAASYTEHALSLEHARPGVWVEAARGTEPPSLQANGWEAWLVAIGQLLQALV